MKLVCLIAMVIGCLTGLSAQAQNAAPSPWQQPAASLADQAADLLGPGQAHLTIRNISTIPTEQIPSIRRLLVQELKARGVLTSGTESANVIRVTLSENSRDRLWVAEVIEGDETRVTMVRLDRGKAQQPQSASGLTLLRQPIVSTGGQVLAALETRNGLVLIEPEEIVIFVQAPDGWQEQKRVGIGQTRALTRDPRGIIYPSADAIGFEAFIPGTTCNGKSQGTTDWTIRCHESDDPWLIVQPPMVQTVSAGQGAEAQMNLNVTPFKAFYNAARNYFTGVVNFDPGTDLPPFYSAAQIVRSAASAPLIFGGIDGKVQLLNDGTLRSVTGTRDWGSDFAAIRTVCGLGTQIVASGSGEASNDSLRAYELPAKEAIPFSAPLAMDGAVTALATSPDGKSLIAIVRTTENQYEVDRVTASCN
ncbi:MAG: hypothetical protein ABSE46_24100 [Terracidiphilus sp.]|jgi:hypothetical protein